MKILFLTDLFYPSIGGIETNAEVLANAFFNKGHSIHLITKTSSPGNKSFPYTVIRNPNAAKLIKEHLWADIIFENNTCLKLSWPAYVFRLPVVVAINTWIERNDGRITAIDRVKIYLLRKAKKVIAVSDAIRKKTFKRAIVIHNPYNVELFKVDPNVIRNKDFVFLGRLVSTKGADLAIKAIKQFNECDTTNHKLTFTIIGDGPERANLEKLVALSNLNENVFFTGALSGETLRKVLNEHRIMIVPSLWEEPFGNIALEGMACGCIPIASDGGGLPEAVGKAGLTFERGNVNSLVSCMKQLYMNMNLFNDLTDAASKHLENHHPDRVARMYLDILNEAKH